MKTHLIPCVLRVSMTLLLLALLLPVAPAALAAPPAPQEEQIPSPPEDDILPPPASAAPSPDSVALNTGMRTLHFPAQSLDYNPSPGAITPYSGSTSGGLRWSAGGGSGSAAFLNIPQPTDWDMSSPVLFHLYFTGLSGGSGNISFFIRPRAFNPGDTYSDGASLNSTAVPYASSKLLKQSFSISAERFGGKALWVIGIQRSSTYDTYAGDVLLLSVGLSYYTRSTPAASLGYAANGLNYNPSFGIITPYGGGTLAGLTWTSSSGAGSAAFLDIPRPTDWDGLSPITLRLYFKPTTTNHGYVDFFIRPRVYNPGDLYGDAASISGSAVYVSAIDAVLRESFTIPAERMGSDSLWVIGIQRGGGEETYSDPVRLLAIGLTYTAQSASTGSLGFAADALNYDAASGVITPSGGGTSAALLWKATYTSAAYLNIPRPLAWDGVTDVTLRLYFLPTTAASGNVEFFIRPRAYNAGDTYGDIGSLSGTAVAAGGTNVVGRQSFTIPASRFGSRDLWVFTVQRGGSHETYSGDVNLLAVELTYRQVHRVYLPLLTRQSPD